MPVGAVAPLSAWAAPIEAQRPRQPSHRNGPVVYTDVGSLRTGIVGLATAERRVLGEIENSVRVFPAETRSAVAAALKASVRRVVGAHQAGRINGCDAAASLEMVREILEALDDLLCGNVTLVGHEVYEDRVQRWQVRAPDGDELVVIVRAHADDMGEARLSFRLMKDDGVKLSSRHRMAARINLERAGTPAVDIQFGGSAMDKHIHGLYRDADGELITSESGRKIADHHFRAGLPERLADPAEFAGMVQKFVDEVMLPLAD